MDRDELIQSILTGMGKVQSDADNIEGAWSDYHEMLKEIDEIVWDLHSQINGADREI